MIAGVSMCDGTCFEQMHLVTSRAGFAQTWGGPHLELAVGAPLGQRLGTVRIEHGWAVSFGDVTEISAAVSGDTRGTFEVSHGFGYFLPRLGLTVPVVGASVAFTTRRELHLRPTVQARMGVFTILATFDLKAFTKDGAFFWLGTRLSL
jgi:hypothetical protein